MAYGGSDGAAGQVIAITQFTGEYRWLSNFWFCPVVYDGVTYNSVEHAYQAAKTLDTKQRVHIQHLDRPGAAKKQGRMLTLRADWGQIKLDVMHNLLQQKFLQPALREKLLQTGDVQLIEGNSWGDTFWGVWRGGGENHLGRLLVQVRSELQYREELH